MTVAQTENSKVVLCTVYDEPSLRTGEFLYDEESDTLYVGAGITDDVLLYVTNFIKHRVTYAHKPSPRIKVNHCVDLQNITRLTQVAHKPAPRTSVIHSIGVYDSIVRDTTVVKTVKHSVVMLSDTINNISLNKEVKYGV